MINKRMYGPAKISLDKIWKNDNVVHIFISDTHFNDKGINYFFDRGFSTVEEMNATLISYINKIVHQHTTEVMEAFNFPNVKCVLWVVGDVGGDNATVDDIRNVLSSIIGVDYFILIRGNHDLLTDDQYKESGFDSVYPSMCCKISDLISNNLSKQQMTENHDTEIMIIHDPACYNYNATDSILIHGHIHHATLKSAYEENNQSAVYNVNVDLFLTKIKREREEKQTSIPIDMMISDHTFLVIY